MSVKPQKSERLHSLDSLRAIMMLLGIVIHSAITYGIIDYGNAWTIKDPNDTSILMDFIVFIIHNFRMPIFFLVAGFFGAMLFFDRGPVKMLKNRFQRIVLPLIVFIFLLAPSIVFAAIYSRSVFEGIPDPFSVAAEPFIIIKAWLPGKTFHLWFLYYLFFITIVSYILGIVFNYLPAFTQFTTRIFESIIRNPILKVIIFSILTAIILWTMGQDWVLTSTSWIPDWNTFIFYFFFYGIGWILFKSKHLLGTFMQNDWIYLVMAIILASTRFFILGADADLIMAMSINAISVWLFIFGITGLFLRYGSKHSELMRYNSDASYWIYLIHLTFTLLLPGVIAEWDVPAIFKFLFVFLTTSVICVVTYHYFVRATFIGKFLNGRTYPRVFPLLRSKVLTKTRGAI